MEDEDEEFDDELIAHSSSDKSLRHIPLQEAAEQSSNPDRFVDPGIDDYDEDDDEEDSFSEDSDNFDSEEEGEEGEEEENIIIFHTIVDTSLQREGELTIFENIIGKNYSKINYNSSNANLDEYDNKDSSMNGNVDIFFDTQ